MSKSQPNQSEEKVHRLEMRSLIRGEKKKLKKKKNYSENIGGRVQHLRKNKEAQFTKSR